MVKKKSVVDNKKNRVSLVPIIAIIVIVVIIALAVYLKYFSGGDVRMSSPIHVCTGADFLPGVNLAQYTITMGSKSDGGGISNVVIHGVMGDGGACSVPIKLNKPILQGCPIGKVLEGNVCVPEESVICRGYDCPTYLGTVDCCNSGNCFEDTAHSDPSNPNHVYYTCGRPRVGKY